MDKLEKLIKAEVEEAITQSDLISSITDSIVTALGDAAVDDIIEKEALQEWAEDNGYVRAEQ